jgi:hypothetical protein
MIGVRRESIAAISVWEGADATETIPGDGSPFAP